MQNLNNWDTFLINENLQQANSYMKKSGRDTSDISYKLIKDLLQNNKSMGYMYLFTFYHYDQKVSIVDLTELLTFLKSNDFNKLRNPVEYYVNYNELVDEIELIKLNKSVKNVYDQLVTSQKEWVMKPTGFFDSKFSTLAQKLDLIENNSSFYDKISKASDYYNLIELMEDFINKYLSGGTYDSIIDKIRKIKDLATIVHSDEKRGIIVASISNYSASASLGSTNWCIVNQNSSWTSHVCPNNNTFNKQYFIWNFNLGISDPNYLCGVTVNDRGEYDYAHDFNDGDILHSLPTHVIELSEFLLPIDPDEITNARRIREESKQQERQDEYLANQRRLQTYIDDNIIRRRNSEWDNDEVAKAMIEHLIDEEDLDLEELAEEGDGTDIYDVLFLTEEDYDNGISTFEYQEKTFKIGLLSNVEEYSLESTKNLLDEFKNNFYKLISNTYLIDECVDEDDIIGNYSEDIYNLDQSDVDDWSEFFDEDDIRYNWEDYDEIIADEDGDMDESSFDDYIQILKDTHEEEALMKIVDDRNSELKDDPMGYLRDIYGDNEANVIISNYVDLEMLASKLQELDGYEHNISSYDGRVYEYTIGENTYSVFRTD